jgi:hypothetical protein
MAKFVRLTKTFFYFKVIEQVFALALGVGFRES